jgi:hypothetical protein
VEQDKELNLLELLEQEEQFAQTPLIISAERELTAVEEKNLQKFCWSMMTCVIPLLWQPC